MSDQESDKKDESPLTVKNGIEKLQRSPEGSDTEARIEIDQLDSKELRAKRSHSREKRSHSRDKRSREKRSRSRDKKSSSRSRRRMSGRSRHRSRSRSPRRRHRSRSGSYSPRHRSTSHSPMSARRRHNGNRDDPLPNRCLGVFGLSIRTTEEELLNYFSKFGPVERMNVVIDAKTARSRGFAFCYFESVEDAKCAKEQCSGMEFDGRRIRVDYSITQRAHTPTPGIYMGKPTYERDRDRDYGRSYGAGRDRYRDDDYGYGGGRDRYRRSPSPRYRSSRRRYERSRSRSYSPRRY